jgi:hypothetical protein
MRFPVSGELALDGTEAAEGIERHAVEAVERAKRINTILGMTGVIEVVVGLVPFTRGFRKEEMVDGGVQLGEGSRTTPVAGSPAVDGVDIHERDESTSGAGIRDGNILTGKAFDLYGILRSGARCGGEPAFDGRRLESGSGGGFDD